MKWAASTSFNDFGTLVTERQGGARSFNFRLPLGVFPPQEVTQVALAFLTEALPDPAVYPHGSFALSVEIGLRPTNPRIADADAFATIAREQRGTGIELRLDDINEVFTNATYELAVAAPAQAALAPFYLRVAAESDLGSTAPSIWSLITSCIVTMVFGGEDAEEETDDGREELRQRLEALEDQRLALESNT